MFSLFSFHLLPLQYLKHPEPLRIFCSDSLLIQKIQIFSFPRQLICAVPRGHVPLFVADHQLLRYLFATRLQPDLRLRCNAIVRLIFPEKIILHHLVKSRLVGAEITGLAGFSICGIDGQRRFHPNQKLHLLHRKIAQPNPNITLMLPPKHDSIFPHIFCQKPDQQRFRAAHLK